jgi:hypothetical protein
MKHLFSKIILISIFCLFSTTVFSKQPKKVASPTLRETLDFIQTKIREYSKTPVGDDGSYSEDELVYSDGCLNLQITNAEVIPENVRRQITIFSLVSLDKNTVRIGDYDGDNIKQITVKYFNKNRLFSVEQKNSNPIYANSSERIFADRSYRTYHISFNINDPDVAQRVAKAFKHAIELCEKSEPF